MAISPIKQGSPEYPTQLDVTPGDLDTIKLRSRETAPLSHESLDENFANLANKINEILGLNIDELNITSAGVISSSNLGISAGSGLGLSAEGEFTHQARPAAVAGWLTADVDVANRQFISALDFDAFGHVVGYKKNTLTFEGGTGITVDQDTNDKITISTDAYRSGDSPTFGSTTIHSSGPILVLKDSNGGDLNTQSGFISYRDNGNIERGYVGFGSESNKSFSMRNNIGDIGISASGAISLASNGITAMNIDTSGVLTAQGAAILNTSNFSQYTLNLNTQSDGKIRSVTISGIQADQTQPKQALIAQLVVDNRNWSSIGTMQVELYESYFYGNRRRRYHINFGPYGNDVAKCELLEDEGGSTGSYNYDLIAETENIGSQLSNGGYIRRANIYVRCKYYVKCSAKVTFNGNYTTTKNPTVQNRVWVETGTPVLENLAGFTYHTHSSFVDKRYASESSLSAYQPAGDYQKQIDEQVVNLLSPAAISGDWVPGTTDDWGSPRIGSQRNRYVEGAGWIEFNVPAGMDTAYISQLQWNTGGYADVYGVQSDGGKVFLRRINTKQQVENTDEGAGGGDTRQLDGSTITLIGTGLSAFTKVRIENRSGRFHLTGLSFSSNELMGTEGTGMVHPEQLCETIGIAKIPTGTTSSTVCIGNDSRLSNARTPTAHNHSASDITSGTLSADRIPSTLQNKYPYLQGRDSSDNVIGAYLPMVPGGLYTTNSSSKTGAIKIKIPTKESRGMQSFFVDIYEYADGESMTFKIGLYNATDITRTSVVNLSDNPNRDFNVRFYTDTNEQYLTIGETSSVWSYPQIAIRDLVSGYQTSQAEALAEWSISFVTSTPGTLNATHSNNYPSIDYDQIDNAPSFYTESEIDHQVARAHGWGSAYGSSAIDNVRWDAVQDAVRIYSSSDSSIGAAYQAMHVKKGDIVRFTVMLKGNVASNSGLYLRVYGNSTLNDGSTFITNSQAEISGQTANTGAYNRTDWIENQPVPLNWTDYTYEYTATANGYISLTILNWDGHGNNSIYVKDPVIKVIGNSARPAYHSTVGVISNANAGGDTLWSIDPSWTNQQLQQTLGIGSAVFVEDSSAPGGYAVEITGKVNTGDGTSASGDGLPLIAIEEDDEFYMECWIKNMASGSTGHYMGTSQYDERAIANASSETSTGFGNPGSFDYSLMANYGPGTTWRHRTALLTKAGSANTTGVIEAGAKYLVPQALFNYSGSTSTTKCRISGWKIIRVKNSGRRRFDTSPYVNTNKVMHSGNFVFNSSTGELSITTTG